MARTKQTARKSMAQGFAGKSVKARGIMKKNKPYIPLSGARPRSPSSDSQKSLDLNVQQFSVRFDNQKECEAKAIPYYVVQCHNCSAYLNSYSKVTGSQSVPQEKKSNKPIRSNKRLSDEKIQELKGSMDKFWECQFCLSYNLLPKSYVEIPPENACYLISKGQGNIQRQEEKGQKLIIYCVDISGSMDTNVQNKSRISAVRQAIRDEIKRMKFQQQKVKIGIVTFGSQVSVYTKTDNVRIPNVTYYDFNKLTEEAKKIKGFASSIQKEFKSLVQSVEKLTTFGSTALGPGLVVSIELASKGPKGSKIILCTDGQANVGINGAQFYTKAAAVAKQKGVIVNILSLKGDNCNLKELGKLTLSTGGSVLKIDPKLLGSEFNKISKEQVLGVQSNLKIKVNHIFQIQNAQVNTLSADKTVMKQNYGSFNAQTELTFNFRTLSKEQVFAKGFNNELANKEKGFMQIQLTYINTDGSRYLQVITDYRQFAFNKDELTKGLNFGLFSASQLQKVSALIKNEKFQEAKSEIDNYNRLVEQTFLKTEKEIQINKFKDKMKTLQKILSSKQLKKQNKGGKMALPVFRKKQQKSKMNKKSRVAFKVVKLLSNSDSDSVVNDVDQDQKHLLMDSDSQEMHLCEFKRAKSVDND